MSALADMFREELDGPFVVVMAVRNLHWNPKMGWVFPATDSIAAPPQMVDRIDDADLTARFAAAVVRGSRYG